MIDVVTAVTVIALAVFAGFIYELLTREGR